MFGRGRHFLFGHQKSRNWLLFLMSHEGFTQFDDDAEIRDASTSGLSMTSVPASGDAAPPTAALAADTAPSAEGASSSAVRRLGATTLAL
jgi:hypothetical protein